MAALTHRETLDSFGAFVPFGGFYECKELFTEEDHLQESASSFQMLPQLCSQLKLLMIPKLEMDIEAIEKQEWSCRDLEELAVRIRGLDTTEKITRTIQLWIDARNQIKESESADSNTLLQDDNSIEGRVARHLLKFPKLQEVWLGAGVKKIAA
ncbi:hypothetical protein BGZ58_008407 [Dissophora ornata]|nr:hypothetical protein BGZ58_008407 [Dissophora ornata]